METAQHALQSALPARRMFSFPHDPKAARRIAVGIGQRQSAAIPSRQQGRRKRILQGALCLLKSGSYLPFPSLPPLAKAAVAPAQMQVSCLPGSVQLICIPSPSLSFQNLGPLHAGRPVVRSVFFLGIRQLPSPVGKGRSCLPRCCRACAAPLC